MNLILNDNLTYHTIDKKMYIFDGEKSRLLTLNLTGIFILEKIKSSHSKSELVKSLCSTFRVDEKTASHDVTTFISKLKKKKVLLEKINSQKLNKKSVAKSLVSKRS